MCNAVVNVRDGEGECLRCGLEDFGLCTFNAELLS